MKEKWTDEEIVAVNDLYHTLLWEQKQGREPALGVLCDRMDSMMAGEKMDHSTVAVSLKLVEIHNKRIEMGLDGLNCISSTSISQAAMEVSLLESLIGSYEYVFKRIEAESAGDDYQMYKTMGRMQ